MAGRAASVITSTTDDTGDIDWVNLSDNWRESDAEWIQNRTVVRVGSDTPTTSNNLIALGTGRVFYSSASGRLIVTTAVTGGTGTYKAVLASDPTTGLIVTDSGSTVTLGIRNQTPTISFDRSNGAITIGTLTNTTFTTTTATATTLTVSGALAANTSFSSRAGASGTFVTNSTGVVINTNNANAVTLTTSASGLTANTGITASSFSTTGNVSAGSLTVSGAFSPASVSTGAISVSSVTSSGTITGSSITATGAISSSGSSVSANTSITAGTTITAGTSVTAASYTSTGEVVIQPPSANSTVRVQSSSGIVNMYHGSGTTVRNAWVVYGATAPAASSVPDGTLWIT